MGDFYHMMFVSLLVLFFMFLVMIFFQLSNKSKNNWMEVNAEGKEAT